jgi:hypothetical protein
VTWVLVPVIYSAEGTLGHRFLVPGASTENVWWQTTIADTISIEATVAAAVPLKKLSVVPLERSLQRFFKSTNLELEAIG